jgi:hypothetical protein
MRSRRHAGRQGGADAQVYGNDSQCMEMTLMVLQAEEGFVLLEQVVGHRPVRIMAMPRPLIFLC